MTKREFINRYSQVATQLFRSFSKDKPGENMVFSPFAILTMLNILSDATCGDARQEVQNAMFISTLERTGMPDWLQYAKKELTKIDFDHIVSDGELFNEHRLPMDYSTHMHTANAMFVRYDYRNRIRPEFQRRFRDVYGGMMYHNWNTETEMKAWLNALAHVIPEAPKAGDASLNILTFLNTVFFDGMWMEPCKKSDMKERYFYNIDNTRSQVKMMYSTAATYVENERATGFIKDFQQCDYSFMALLPKAKGPESAKRLLNSCSFAELRNWSIDARVRVVMPEFTIETEKNLKNACVDLGIKKALTDKADYYPLTTARIPDSRMIHRAKIELNRNGVKADTASKLIPYGTITPEEKKEVILNRPFLFAIMHRTLNIPVFMGVVNRMEAA